MKITKEAIKITELYSVVHGVIQDNSNSIENAYGVNGERIAISIVKAIIEQERHIEKRSGHTH